MCLNGSLGSSSEGDSLPPGRIGRNGTGGNVIRRAQVRTRPGSGHRGPGSVRPHRHISRYWSALQTDGTAPPGSSSLPVRFVLSCPVGHHRGHRCGSHKAPPRLLEAPPDCMKIGGARTGAVFCFERLDYLCPAEAAIGVRPLVPHGISHPLSRSRRCSTSTSERAISSAFARSRTMVSGIVFISS